MRRVLLATVFVGCMCGCNFSDNGAYVHAEREQRKKLTEPVIEALEKYKEINSRYPDRLDQLSLTVPDLASDTDHLGKTGKVENAKPLQYAVKEDGYELRFSFSHPRPALTAANTTYFLYVSQDKKWYLAFGDFGSTLPPAFPKRENQTLKDKPVE